MRDLPCAPSLQLCSVGLWLCGQGGGLGWPDSPTLIRLPFSFPFPSSSALQVRGYVDEVVDLVDLTEIMFNLVGVPGQTGLSVEQRKRLTIANEMVANPSVIFMDEPTSGAWVNSWVRLQGLGNGKGLAWQGSGMGGRTPRKPGMAISYNSPQLQTRAHLASPSPHQSLTSPVLSPQMKWEILISNPYR